MYWQASLNPSELDARVGWPRSSDPRSLGQTTGREVHDVAPFGLFSVHTRIWRLALLLASLALGGIMFLPVVGYVANTSLGQEHFSTQALFFLFTGAVYIFWTAIYVLARTRWLSAFRQMPLDVKALAYLNMVAGGVLLLSLLTVLTVITAVAGLAVLALRALFGRQCGLGHNHIAS